jgi:acyl carrier protein
MSGEVDFQGFRIIVAEALEVEPILITRATTAGDVDGWDSVSHATLIMAVERAFDFQFADSEIFGFENVGALFDRAMQLRKQ